MFNSKVISKLIKQAQRQEGFPGVFEPVRKDPYKPRRPGDGQGYSRNQAGGEGSAGNPVPDMGAAQFGTKDREGYPSDISQWEDTDESNNEKHIPGAQDTGNEDPFTGKNQRTPYGTGLVDDSGVQLHDDAGSPGDSAIGANQTALRGLDADNMDRAFPLANPNSAKSKFNLKEEQSRNDIFGRVKRYQRL